jgi:hypothetical protein
MALLAAHTLALRVYSRRMLLVVLATLFGGTIAALLQALLNPSATLLGFVQSALVAGGCALAALLALLETRERRGISDWVRARIGAF